MTDFGDVPAFPIPQGPDTVHFGISMRDYFAAAALPGVLAARASVGGDMLQESIAEECYELADALVVARLKTPDEEPTS
jgi:hypothetical protein